MGSEVQNPGRGPGSGRFGPSGATPGAKRGPHCVGRKLSLFLAGLKCTYFKGSRCSKHLAYFVVRPASFYTPGGRPEKQGPFSILPPAEKQGKYACFLAQFRQISLFYPCHWSDLGRH